MDGGWIPERPDELEPDINMNKALAGVPQLGDYEGGSLFIGTKGKISCGWGGRNPRLLPLSLNNDIDVPQKYPHVEDSANGHWGGNGWTLPLQVIITIIPEMQRSRLLDRTKPMWILRLKIMQAR